MNRLTKIFLSFFSVITILALTYPAVAKRIKTDDGKAGFGIEISIPGRQPFTLSVKAKNERSAILPVNGANAYAVRVLPLVVGNSLKFKLLAVTEKLPELLSCDNMKGLKAELVASYVAHEGDVIRVSDFEKFGVSQFTVKVISLSAVQTTCPDGACCCGGNTCYPNPGRCIECGGCGLCCKSGGGGGEEEFNMY